VLVTLVLGGVAALGVRRELTAGRDAIEAGRDQLSGGDPVGAADAFASAAAAFGDAARGGRSVPLRILGAIPFVGRTPDAVTAVADAGRLTALAGAEVADGIAALPDGIGSLAPRDGAIPIAPLRSLAGPLARADALATRAFARIHAAPRTLLVGPVGQARRAAEDQLAPLHETLHAAAVIVAGLPAFLGDERPSRFYFAAAGPAEQRGTGGLIGAYSFMTIR
jgi:hypothetical protein